MTTFEHAGFWWDPAEPATRWPGTLRFDRATGAVLKLTRFADLRHLFADGKEFELLHGETTGGLAISLIDCFERRHDEIYANSVLAGFHAPSTDPLITAAAGIIEQLDEWWQPRAIANDDSLSHPDIGIQYRQPADVEVHDDGVIKTSIRSSGLPSFGPRQVSIREEIRIEMKAAAPQKLSVFRKRMHACQDFVSVAALTPCNLTALRLVPPYEDKRDAVIATFHAVPLYKDPGARWPDFLFRSPDIESRLPAVFGAWLEGAERLSVVRSLYFSGTYGKSFLELRLLAFTQAAEAYHRRVHEGRDLYMDAAAYAQDVLPLLQGAIPAGLDAAHRQVLRKRLQYGNEFSFRKRITGLFRAHEAALAAAIPDPCSWIERIVEYRNALTHHPVVSEEPDRDKTVLLQCNFVLQTLLEFCFLQSMWLDGKAIAALAAKCERYRKVRKRFFPERAGRLAAATASPRLGSRRAKVCGSTSSSRLLS